METLLVILTVLIIGSICIASILIRSHIMAFLKEKQRENFYIKICDDIYDFMTDPKKEELTIGNLRYVPESGHKQSVTTVLKQNGKIIDLNIDDKYLLSYFLIKMENIEKQKIGVQLKERKKDGTPGRLIYVKDTVLKIL